MNIPHNFWLGFVCWVFGVAITVRVFWIFPVWVPRRTLLEKGLIALVFVALFLWAVHKPVVKAYVNRNGEAQKQRNASALPPFASSVQGEIPTPSQESHPHPAGITGAKNTTMYDVTVSGYQTGIDLSHSEKADLQKVRVFASSEELKLWFNYLLQQHALDGKVVEDEITAKRAELAKSGRTIPPGIVRQLRELEHDPEKLKAFLQKQSKQ